MTSLLTNSFIEKVAKNLPLYLYDVGQVALPTAKDKKRSETQKDLLMAENAAMGGLFAYGNVGPTRDLLAKARRKHLLQKLLKRNPSALRMAQKFVFKPSVYKAIMKSLPVAAPIAGAAMGSNIIEKLYPI